MSVKTRTTKKKSSSQTYTTEKNRLRKAILNYNKAFAELQKSYSALYKKVSKGKRPDLLVIQDSKTSKTTEISFNDVKKINSMFRNTKIPNPLGGNSGNDFDIPPEGGPDIRCLRLIISCPQQRTRRITLGGNRLIPGRDYIVTEVLNPNASCAAGRCVYYAWYATPPPIRRRR